MTIQLLFDFIVCFFVSASRKIGWLDFSQETFLEIAYRLYFYFGIINGNEKYGEGDEQLISNLFIL